MHTDNPLLSWSHTPDFSAIQAAHIAPAVNEFLHWAEGEIASLEAAAPTTFEELIRPLEQVVDVNGRLISLLRHLLQVVDIEGWREAYEAAQPRLIAFATRLGQSPALYAAMKAIVPASGVQRRILEKNILDAELAGVALPEAEREAFRQTAQELGSLMTRFGANMLEEQKSWSHTITDPASVEGLPSSWRALAAQRARAAGAEDATPESGPWRLSLNWGSLRAVLVFSTDRALREHCRRAISRVGGSKNEDILRQILSLRAEQAARLGYDSYLSLSLADKMAPSLDGIESLLDSLMQASSEPAQAEAAELESLAAASGHPTPLQPWDIYFWSERLRESRFGLKDDEVRPYFAFDQVLKALFFRSSALFGVRIEPADGTVPVWHDDVRYFNVFRGTERIASFFLDPFARPGEKRSGAWMNPLLARSANITSSDAARCPVAVLVCNQTPPVDGMPSLMIFREVETLFHEFGHGLHHMLTTVDERMVAGISGVEWDAVELPSMWMEGWCTHRPTLRMMARHYETDEPMPGPLLEQLMAAKNFRAATALRGQLGWTKVDLALHVGAPPEEPIAVQQSILGECWQGRTLDGDMWICSFNHIFGGSSYAAAYYSYLWAEVLATDAFSAFEEVDAEDEPALTALGQRFWSEVLSVGGARHPMENFSAFRGRPPSTDALLRVKGLVSAQT